LSARPKTQQLEWEFPERLEFLFKPSRYKVAHGGRGGAKSWGFARALLILAWQGKKRIGCMREVQNSIKDSVHRLLCDQIQRMGLGSFYEITQTEIRGKNGSEFLFAGLSNLTAESIKSYEGLDICWVEEAQKVRQRSLDILIPTVRKDGSELWFSMNPELETDAAYERLVSSPPKDAIVVSINWRDNPWFPKVLEDERKEFLRQVEAGKRTQDEYDNIWEGKCRASVQGAIFAKELSKAKSAGRIGEVAWDTAKLVNTSWDIGKGDPTAIWFWQSFAGEVAFIDYFEDRGEDITYYLEKLASKPYRYATHYLPHDSRQDRLGMPRTIERVVIDNGYKVEVIPVRSLKDQINETRLLLARARFDETKCRAGLESLRHYRWGYNTSMDELKAEPVHDWASHGSSAMMAAAMSFRLDTGKPKTKAIQYSSAGVV
jgi:phage terminase large subunit